MERVVGRAGETDLLENRLMSTRQRATLPRALSKAHRQFDRRRSRQRKRARLPQELWHQAVALAHEHGLNKIALAATIIGVVTFALSYLGVCIGKKFGHFFESKIEALGGITLIAIALKIVLEHTL
jgi:hypothetical protein